jgi:hypothetical protein
LPVAAGAMVQVLLKLPAKAVLLTTIQAVAPLLVWPAAKGPM